MKTLEEVINNITQVETEISNLEAKSSELDEKLYTIKKDAVAILSNEGEKEIQSLIAHRQIVTEALAERVKQLEVLRQELIEAEQEEARKENFLKCIELTKEADTAQRNSTKMAKALDEEFNQKLLDVFDERMKWKKAAELFMNLADTVALGFKANTKTENEEEATANRKAFLEQVEAKAGVSTDAVRTELFLNWRRYNEISLTQGKYAIETDTPILELAEKASLRRARLEEIKAKEVA